MIAGLGAAIGWGLADLVAALSGRRIGAWATVVIAQAAGALLVSAAVVLTGADLGGLSSVAAWLLPSAVITAVAYLTLYRALELGPVAVVSPVLASYAVFPVLLAVVLLGETMSGLQVAGVVVTISGAVITSADIRELRAGTRSMPPGLSWAIVSTVLFGVATYVLGWASQRAGFLPSLWLGRTASAVLFVAAAPVVSRAMRRRSFSGLGSRALVLAAGLGIVDVGGTMSYAFGAEHGLVSIVTAVSATYPLIPVFGSVILLGEHPAPNQYLGVAMVISGLVLLGLAA